MRDLRPINLASWYRGKSLSPFLTRSLRNLVLFWGWIRPSLEIILVQNSQKTSEMCYQVIPGMTCQIQKDKGRNEITEALQ